MQIRKALADTSVSNGGPGHSPISKSERLLSAKSRSSKQAVSGPIRPGMLSTKSGAIQCERISSFGSHVST